jgi:eukaryotic-like serine/threonine-protein kinase
LKVEHMPDESSAAFSLVKHLNEVIAAYIQAIDAGLQPDRQALLDEHPELAPLLRDFFADQDRMHKATLPFQPVNLAEAPTLTPEQVNNSDGNLAMVRHFGDYELLQEIARGGMGVVYKARQVSLNRIVALKMILAGQLASPQDVQRFRSEAEAAANLDHPNIVPIYEVGEYDGQHYFSMKLVEGSSLAQWIAGCRLPIADSWALQRNSAALIAAVARAVYYAHQRGILHRDLKPGNILLQSGESAIRDLQSAIPYVTDFGLARRVEGGSNVTKSGDIVGTPSYMAPEQVRAEKGLSTAVDIYSLGAILYELLAGRPPFRAETQLDIYLQVLEREPVSPSKINARLDRDLETICLKCLEKEPTRRYGSAEALADDLERWLAGEPIRARPVGVVEKAAKWVKRRPVVAGLLAALLLVAAVSGVLVAWSYGEALRQTKIAKDKRDAARTAENNERTAKDRTQQALELNERVLTGIRVGQANAAVHAHDLARGLSLLENCQEKARFWEWYYTRRLCRGASFTLHRENALGAFRYAVFSPDAHWIAATTDEAVTLFDARTGEKQWSGKGRYGPAVFSPDSGRVVAVAWIHGGSGPGLKFWDVHTHEELLTIPADPPKAADGKVGFYPELVFSPDGRWLAFGGAGKAAVWNTHTGAKKFSIPVKPGSLALLAYKPDGSSLAVCDAEAVRFLDPLTGLVQRELLRDQLKTAAKGTFNAAFSPDGRRLALALGNDIGESRAVRILDLDTGTELRDFPLPQPLAIGPVGYPFVFSPDGQQLVFRDWNNQQVVQLVDVATGKSLRTLPQDGGG